MSTGGSVVTAGINSTCGHQQWFNTAWAASKHQLLWLQCCHLHSIAEFKLIDPTWPLRNGQQEGHRDSSVNVSCNQQVITALQSAICLCVTKGRLLRCKLRTPKPMVPANWFIIFLCSWYDLTLGKYGLAPSWYVYSGLKASWHWHSVTLTPTHPTQNVMTSMGNLQLIKFEVSGSWSLRAEDHVFQCSCVQSTRAPTRPS